MILDNDQLFKRTNKGQDIIGIKNYIVEKIEESQIIRRYCRWLTRTPLSSNGLTYNGETVKQTDLDDKYKLIKKIVEPLQGMTGQQILYPYPFNEDIVNEEQPFLFIYNYSNNFSGRSTGKNIFEVSVCMPLTYNEIYPYGDERLYRIVGEIINIFDGKTVEGEKHRKVLGDLQFEVRGVNYPYRLTKTKNIIVYPLKIEVRTSNFRG